jgi:hypothetical protein
VGDVERAKYLVQREAVDVNKRDRWDSVPLYYACLAGLRGGLSSAGCACMWLQCGRVLSTLFVLQVTRMLRRCFWSMAQSAMNGRLTVSMLAEAPINWDA